MDKSVPQETTRRRDFFIDLAIMTSALPIILLCSCSAFNKSSKKGPTDAAFSEDEDDEDQDSSSERIFEAERKKQADLSEFVAQNGRNSKKKQSSVRPGDDFLLSSKAKEIYANTER